MRNIHHETEIEKKIDNKLHDSKKLRLYLYKVEAEYRRRKKTAGMIRLFRFLTH